MNKFLLIAFAVIWKVSYLIGSERWIATERREFETEKEAVKFSKHLPGGVWGVKILQIHKGREIGS